MRDKTSALPDWPVTIEQDIVWGDMDAFAHVNNTVYFRYFESARMRYFETIGYVEHLRATQQGPILAKTECTFRAPLTYPDSLTIGCRTIALHADRFLTEYTVWSKRLQTAAARGTGMIVSYDYTTHSPCPLPNNVRVAIQDLDGIS